MADLPNKYNSEVQVPQITAIQNTVNTLTPVDTTVDPTATDDLAGGYDVGRIWVNTTSDQAFISVDSTNGAAIWKQIT